MSDDVISLGMANSRSASDHYTQRARKEGYPARSVYKLEEIQKKFSIIRKGDAVLDIGASPGSWTLYVSRRILGKSGSITSVDLKPLSLNPLPPNAAFFQGDAFSEEIISSIAPRSPFNVIISDAAPATTGNRTVDTARSEGLAEEILQLSETMLGQGGNLVIKLFQGGGERELLDRMSRMFQRAKAFKPKASRDDSFEIFLIGRGMKETAIS